MRGHQVDVYEYRDGKWSANQAVLLGRSEHNSLGKRAPSPAAAEQFASAGVEDTSHLCHFRPHNNLKYFSL